MQSNTQLFESENINTSMLKLAYPSIIAMLFTALGQIITSAFVGIINDTSLLATIAVVFPVFTSINALGQMVGIGAAAMGGRALGKSEKQDFKAIAVLSLIFGIIIAITVSVIGLLFIDKLANFLGVTNDTKDYSFTYLKFLLMFAVFPILNMIFNNLFRCLGKVLHSMNTMLIAAFLNIGLDALFLFVFKLKALGLVMSLIISQGAAVLYSVIYFLAKKQLSLKTIKNIEISNLLKEILAVGGPTFLMQLFSSIAFGILNSAASKISTKAVAGFGIGNKIYMLIFQTILGYTQAFLPFCAYNYGKKEKERLKKGLGFSILLTASVGLFFTLLFVFLKRPICSIFSSDKEVVKNAALSLWVHSLPLTLVAFIQTLTVYFQGVKKPFLAGTLSLTRQGLFLIPLSYFVPKIFSESFLAITLVQPVADTLCFILTLIIFIVVFKKEKIKN